MLWLWILAGIVLLFILLCLLRLGVLVNFADTAEAYVSVGPIRIQVAPSKKKKDGGPEQEKKPKTTKQAKEEKPGKEKKSFPKPTLSDIRSAYDELWPPTRRALRRTRRGIRIHPLELSLTLGGQEDPAAAAQSCGYASAAVWTGMPVLEQLLDIPDPSIHLGTDFESAGTRIQGRVGISIRIGTLLAVGLQIGIPALRWLLRYLKRHKKADKQRETGKNETAAAEKVPAA